MKSLKQPEEKVAVGKIPRDAYLVQPRGNHHYFDVFCCHSSEVKYTSQMTPVKQEIFPMNKSQAHLPMFLSDWLSYAFIATAALPLLLNITITSRILKEVGLISFFL